MVLNNKVAVIYGAGGGIGGPVARAFAREGATLFLTGRHRAAGEAVAQDIVSAGGGAGGTRFFPAGPPGRQSRRSRRTSFPPVDARRRRRSTRWTRRRSTSLCDP